MKSEDEKTIEFAMKEYRWLNGGFGYMFSA